MVVKLDLTPINGISALTKLFSSTLFSTFLRGRKEQKIISNLLNSDIINQHSGFIANVFYDRRLLFVDHFDITAIFYLPSPQSD